MTDAMQHPKPPHELAAAVSMLVAVAGALGLPAKLGLDADSMAMILASLLACASTIYAVLTRRAKE